MSARKRPQERLHSAPRNANDDRGVSQSYLAGRDRRIGRSPNRSVSNRKRSNVVDPKCGRVPFQPIYTNDLLEDRGELLDECHVSASEPIANAVELCSRAAC